MTLLTLSPRRRPHEKPPLRRKRSKMTQSTPVPSPALPSAPSMKSGVSPPAQRASTSYPPPVAQSPTPIFSPAPSVKRPEASVFPSPRTPKTPTTSSSTRAKPRSHLHRRQAGKLVSLQGPKAAVPRTWRSSSSRTRPYATYWMFSASASRSSKWAARVRAWRCTRA